MTKLPNNDNSPILQNAFVTVGNDLCICNEIRIFKGAVI